MCNLPPVSEEIRDKCLQPLDTENLFYEHFNDDSRIHFPLIAHYANVNPNETNLIRCTSLTANEFINAVYLAYALHGELTLSPDDVWLTIAF